MSFQYPTAANRDVQGDLHQMMRPSDASGSDNGPSKSGPMIAEIPPANRALSTAELRRDKPDRHAFQTRARLPVQVVLDGVRQGYNVGALFRLCDAFLCARLVICGRDGAKGMRKLIQAAQGTHKWVEWEQRDSAAEAVRPPVPAAIKSSRSSRRAKPCLWSASRPATLSAWCSARSGPASRRPCSTLPTPRLPSLCGAWPTRSTSRPPRPSSCTGWRWPAWPLVGAGSRDRPRPPSCVEGTCPEFDPPLAWWFHDHATARRRDALHLSGACTSRVKA